MMHRAFLAEISVLLVAAGFIAILSLSGCKNEPQWKQNQFKKVELPRTTSDPQLPEILWQRIEAVYTGATVTESEPEGEAGAGAGAGEDGEGSAGEKGKAPKAEAPAAEKKAASEPAKKEGEGEGAGAGPAAELEKGVLPTEFAPLKVYLIEKNHGLLHGVNHEITLGPGGGEIDLQDFVENKKGSFYFVAEFLPEVPIEKGSPNRKIFFLSNGVRRRNKFEAIGNGCHNYFDITTSFEAAMTDTGYLLNTSDARHVSALAGTFFFAVKNEGKLFIAQLTIKDSSHRALQCRTSR